MANLDILNLPELSGNSQDMEMISQRPDASRDGEIEKIVTTCNFFLVSQIYHRQFISDKLNLS